MGQVEPMVKGTPVMTVESLKKIEGATEQQLGTIYLTTFDQTQKALIRRIFKLEGWTLPEPVEEPPLMVG